MKVALVTTPPSLRSGIGDYTRQLAPYLAQDCELQVYVPDGSAGEKLAGTELTSTGELLVFDSSGRLQVLDEIAHKSKFKLYYVEKEDETARPEEEEKRRPGKRPSRDRGDDLLDERRR